MTKSNKSNATETIERTETIEPTETTETIVEPEQLEQFIEQTEAAIERTEEIVEQADQVEASEPISLEQIIDTILEQFPNDQITPYLIAKAVNAALTVLGVLKQGEPYSVRPQMIYNYDTNGLIVAGSKKLKRYTKAQVRAFAIKFIQKRTAS
jgi:hypothetical protein